MNHAIRFLSIFLGAVGIAHAVPNAINYQGRLTDGDGNPASGSKLFSLSLYDAATAGNELYAETIGSIAVDENGIYNFQFGANGTSTVAEAETLAVADGSSTVYTATPSSTPIAGTLSVTDGTYSWNEVDGNPGELATATTQLVNSFVIGYVVTNGGEGYTTAPVVTINGDGIGATATAEVTNGVVTAINVGDVGSGYTNATVSIAEPPAPFVVDYSAGELTFTYEAAPSAGVQITASYDANDTSIVGALSAADAHWLELSIDGDTQSPRERILSVPFALVAGSARTIKNLVERNYSCRRGWDHFTSNSEYLKKTTPLSTTRFQSYAYTLNFDYSVKSISRLNVVLEGNAFQSNGDDALLQLRSIHVRTGELTILASVPLSRGGNIEELTIFPNVAVNTEEYDYDLAIPGYQNGSCVIISLNLTLLCESLQ